MLVGKLFSTVVHLFHLCFHLHMSVAGSALVMISEHKKLDRRTA